jgi:ligand-binding SRPBCC domain-containing protein
MPLFVKSVLIHAPLETVFGFHEREDALQLLTPAFPRVRVMRKQGGIETGGRVEMKIGPILWIALHTAFQKNSFFEDRQIAGPFARWIHCHEFEAIGNDTRLTDRIDYQLSGGPWANRLLGWTIQLGLQRMFRYRHQTTRRYCEPTAQ